MRTSGSARTAEEAQQKAAAPARDQARGPAEGAAAGSTTRSAAEARPGHASSARSEPTPTARPEPTGGRAAPSGSEGAAAKAGTEAAAKAGTEAAAKAGAEAAAKAGSARKKERAKDPLLAAICHDLRAPLAAVTMGANFVLQTTPEDEASGRSRRVLQAILRSCKQMERLVRDFGDLSEIESDALELRMGIHDSGQMLEMAAEAARQNALARNIEIAVRRAEPPPLLRCDRERMLRAIAHVLDNAVRFSPDGGSVSLTEEVRDGDVRISVSDQGPGLSEETLANLYDRTWHAKRAERVGAGLGLAIVKGFLRAHGGRIEIATTPGATTFTLVLPRDGAAPTNDVAPA
ncbi:MAG: HAMP domain-containing histidine kinase [Labilithrix sp.]|nr:HAMP domain-containing histidine kinase [Labilithrix sp.]